MKQALDTPDHTPDAAEQISHDPTANTCTECGDRPRLGRLTICKHCLQARSDATRQARAEAEQRAQEKTAAKQTAQGKVKRCRCCGQEKPLASFNRWARSKDGYRHDCQTCVSTGKAKQKPHGKKSAAERKAKRAQEREKAKAPHRRAAHRKHVADWQARNPDAVAARAAVRKALKAGTIGKSKRCQVHGCYERDRLEGHHFDYAHPLHVVWLCPSHHKAAHAGHSLKIVHGLHPALLGIPDNLTPKPKEVLTDAFDQSKTPQARTSARTPRRHRTAVPATAE